MNRDELLLPAVLIDRLLSVGTEKAYPKGARVISQGARSDFLYVLVAGSVKVFITAENGKEIVVNTLGARQYFGELMLTNELRTASVQTLTPSRISIIRKTVFEALLREHPELALHVIGTLIERVRCLTDRVHSLALIDVSGRVARLLLDRSRTAQGRTRVFGLSQQAIADEIGSSRSMVSKVFKDLTASGHIVVGKGWIELLKRTPGPR
ncbi:MAG: Crp/Fnr family transcriptional regulator [Lautropia sp.]